jgi:hypothetical protein
MHIRRHVTPFIVCIQAVECAAMVRRGAEKKRGKPEIVQHIFIFILLFYFGIRPTDEIARRQLWNV